MLTPYMSLLYPDVSVTFGPQWATDLNNAAVVIDSHDHTIGKGVSIPTAGININADLNFNGYNATGLRSTRYQAQLSPLALVTDINCAYFSGVDLWVNDGNGNQIQLTAGGALNASSIGGIGGDYTTSTASVFYTSATQTFTFWQNTNQAAIIDVGTIFLRNPSIVSSPIVAIRINPSMTTNWILTLPVFPPASTQYVVMDSSGTLGFTTPTQPEWMTHVVTGSHAFNTTYTCKKRVIGDSADYRIYINYSGAPNPTALVINLGDTIITSKLPDNSSGIPILGTAALFDIAGGTGSGNFSGLVRYDSPTTVEVQIIQPVSGSGQNDLRIVTHNDPITIAAGDYIFLDIQGVPIS